MPEFLSADIDECMEKGGRNGNYCQLNTKCVNKLGSYECECLNGYKRLDKYNCVEIDECKSNQHSCHENADCINTIGSYNCRCKEGYTGNGYECERKWIDSRIKLLQIQIQFFWLQRFVISRVWMEANVYIRAYAHAQQDIRESRVKRTLTNA